jgi:hypothetical protein
MRSWRSCRGSRRVRDQLTPEAIWTRRVDRGLGPTASREQADAAHKFLREVDGQPANWISAGVATDTEEEAQLRFMNELGRISGVGPMPS